MKVGRAIACAAVVAVAAMPAAEGAKQSKKKEPKKVAPQVQPAPEGKQIDFDYDGKDVGHPERAWFGRVFVPTAAQKATGPLPMFVFIHGTNQDAIKYRWFGAGPEGDVRRMIVELIDAGKIAPMLIAAPSQIKPESTVNAVTSWPSFDLDHLDRKSVV